MGIAPSFLHNGAGVSDTKNKNRRKPMMKDLQELGGQARYIGSLPKDDQMCDFYEVEVDGSIRYVYVPVKPEEKNAD
jgi:hypothetical protein